MKTHQWQVLPEDPEATYQDANLCERQSDLSRVDMYGINGCVWKPWIQSKHFGPLLYHTGHRNPAQVLLLCEFKPKNGRLLGVNWNRGAKICLRLRDAHNSSHLLPYESVLATMLHVRPPLGGLLSGLWLTPLPETMLSELNHNNQAALPYQQNYVALAALQIGQTQRPDSSQLSAPSISFLRL